MQILTPRNRATAKGESVEWFGLGQCLSKLGPGLTGRSRVRSRLAVVLHFYIFPLK